MNAKWVVSIIAVSLLTAMVLVAYGCGSSAGTAAGVNLSLKVNS